MQKQWTVELIGGFKLIKGVLLLTVATGLLSLLHGDQATVLSEIVPRFSADPNARYFQLFARKFLQLSTKLPLISTGLYFYAILFITEGIGLLLRKRWAEYLTVFTTGAFLPLEVYEIVHKPTATKAIVIALNFAIVVYLIYRLHQRGRNSHENHSGSSWFAWLRHKKVFR